MEMRPIDYVVPMVFHDDPLWQEDFRKVHLCYDESNKYDFVRFRSWDTEELLIRCVRRFMPFVRNIYILLARESQKKEWMDADGITVVYHRDFIPERFLPTFNSCAIEMFLHRIQGLSERFIYGNDDMFPVAPLTEKDFFEGDIPCLHHVEKPFPDNPNIWHFSCRNGLNFVAQEFRKTYKNSFLRGGHSLTPMLKSTWEYLWRRADEIEASISPTRESRNFNQWLCPWWHHLSGNYVDRVPDRSYVSTNRSIEEIVRVISLSNGIVCVNDNECADNYMDYGNAVKMCLEKKLKD